MRLGTIHDAASVLLVAWGLLQSAAALLTPLLRTSWSLPGVVLGFLFGLVFWHAGRLIRKGHVYGHHLGLAGLLLLLVEPYFFGGTPTLGRAALLVVMMAIVGASLSRQRRAPAA